MKKDINFIPAFDRRNPDPSLDYGIRGVIIWFVLSGELGAVQFLLNTNWYLPHIQKEFIKEARKKDEVWLEAFLCPQPFELGYHSPVPLYDGQMIASDSCPYLDGKPCYLDGSELQARPVLDILIQEGDAGVWKYLEEFYINTFGELK